MKEVNIELWGSMKTKFITLIGSGTIKIIQNDSQDIWTVFEVIQNKSKR